MLFLQRVDPDAKLQEITEAVYQEIEMLCQCGFGGDRITDSMFQCCSSNQDLVTYHARLHGTALATSQQLISHIETWIASNRITVQRVSFGIDSNAPVSIDDPNCDDDTPTDQSESLNMALIGGAAGGGFAVVIVITVAVAIAVIVRMVKRHRTTPQHTP